MKSKLGISKQLFIALTIVNLSVTLFSVVLGYVIYNYAIEKGWISLSSEKGKGVWSTDNSKKPVGQCKVTLPKPDLATIEATLTMGYTAKFDGGTVRPNPPHTRFSFTLNSASRRKS